MKQGLGGIEIYNELLGLYTNIEMWATHLGNKTKKRKEIIKEMQYVLRELGKKLKKSTKE